MKCRDTASLVPDSNSLTAFLTPLVLIAGTMNRIFKDSSRFIIPTEKNSRSTFMDLIPILFFLQSDISPDTTSTLASPRLTSLAARNAREPSLVQFAVAKQLKSHVPFLYFDFIVFTILLNLSYLPTRCLSMGHVHRRPEHAVPPHPAHGTVHHLLAPL